MAQDVIPSVEIEPLEENGEANRDYNDEHILRALVIGGDSCICWPLVSRLLLMGKPVRVLHKNANRIAIDPPTIITAEMWKKVEFVEGSLEEFKILEDACNDVSSVFVLSTASEDTLERLQWLSDIKVTTFVETFEKLVGICLAQDVQQLLFCSDSRILRPDCCSCTLSDEFSRLQISHSDLNSTDVICPTDCNCLTRGCKCGGGTFNPYRPFSILRTLEQVILQANGLLTITGCPLKTISIRPSLLYGYVGGLEDILLRDIRIHRTRYIVGDGTALAHFTHVDNAVAALIAASTALFKETSKTFANHHHLAISGRAFNITDGYPVRYWSFVSALYYEMGYPRPYLFLPYWLVLIITWSYEHLFGSSFPFMSPTFSFTLRNVRLYGGRNCSLFCSKPAIRELQYKPILSTANGLDLCIANAVRRASSSEGDAAYHRGEAKKQILVGSTTGRKKLSTRHTVNASRAVNSSVTGMICLSIMRLLSALLSVIFFIQTFCSVFSSVVSNSRIIHVYHLLPYISIFSYCQEIIDYWNRYSRILFLPMVHIIDNGYSIMTSLCMAMFFLFLSVLLDIYNNRGTMFGYNSNLPLIGDFLAFSKAPISFCIRMAKECMGFYYISFFGKPIIYVAGKDGSQFFFKMGDDEVSMKEVYKVTTPIFGKGLIYDAKLDIRQQQFHFLSTGLSEAKMKMYVSYILQECETFFNTEWLNEGICESAIDFIGKLISMTACRCLLGREIRECMFSELSALLHDLDQGITYISAILPNLPIRAHKQRNKARKQLSEMFSYIINMRKKSNQEYKIKEDTKREAQISAEESDVLSILMKAEYKDGTKLSDDDICGLLICLIFAGQHTSSLTCTWLLINLLLHRETYLPRVLDEVNEIKGYISYNTITNESNFLLACLIESLRMHPPLGNLMRYVKKPLFHKGHLIEEGSILAISLYEAGRNSEIFSSADTFLPSRWLTEDWDSWRQMYKYVMFGAGRHTCMGRRFAILQIKTILIYLFSNFSMIALSPKPKIDEKGMVIAPAQKFSFQYKRINPKEDTKKSWGFS